MKVRTVEITITCEKCDQGILDLLRLVLMDRFGVDQSCIVEAISSEAVQQIRVYLDDSKYARKMPLTLKRLFHDKNITLSSRVLKESDWKNKWKTDLKPFFLTRNLRVVPEWAEGRCVKIKRGCENIYLDPFLAFGTGLHETTRFMTELIEERAGRIKSFLDIGTGTGILSIAAAKCGAKEICALDVSEDAVLNARKNFTRNHVVPLWVRAGDVRKMTIRQRFDFVAANLTSEELICCADKIARCVCPGGYLAVSGINLKDFESAHRGFRERFLRCVRIKKGVKWAAVLYRKQEDYDA